MFTAEERTIFWEEINEKLYKLSSDLDFELLGNEKETDAQILRKIVEASWKLQEMAKKQLEKAEKALSEEIDRKDDSKNTNALEYQLGGCLMSFDELEYEEAI